MCCYITGFLLKLHIATVWWSTAEAVLTHTPHTHTHTSSQPLISAIIGHVAGVMVAGSIGARNNVVHRKHRVCVCLCVFREASGSRSARTCDAQRLCFSRCVCGHRAEAPAAPLSSAVCQVLVEIIIPASLKLTFIPESSRPTDTLINGPLRNSTK